MRNRITVLVTAFFLSSMLASVAWGQTQPAQPSTQNSSSMPAMNMSDHDTSNMDMSNMKDMPGMDKDKDADSDTDRDVSAHAMHSMEGHMDMGPHMKMTALRLPKSGDAARAKLVVESARKTSEKYTDHHAALPTATRFSIPRFRKRCITSLITDTPWKTPSASIRNIPRRCSTKSTATITN
jgi:uncharacterized protein involved in copper resistance